MKDAIRFSSASRQSYTPGTFYLEALPYHQAILDRYSLVTNKVLTEASRHAALTDYKRGEDHVDTPPRFDSGFTWRDFATGGGTVMGNVERYFSGMGDYFVTGIIRQMGRDGQNPLWQVKGIGDYILVGTQAYIFAVPVIKGALRGAEVTATTLSNQPLAGAPAGVAAGVIAAVGETFSELWETVKPASYLLLYIGYFLSIWLPAVPFLVMVLAAVGWVIACLESFIAGSLWVAAHTLPTQEHSFIGSQTQGYLLVLSLFFRPALIVMGLIASMELLSPLVRFTNEAFILFFRMIQADSTIGLLSVAGYMLLYSVLMLSMFLMLFTLPQMLPDRILKWIGAGTGDLGETGGYAKIDQTASTQARAAMVGSMARQNTLKQQKDAKARDAAKAGHGAVRSTGSGAGNDGVVQ